MLLTILLQVWNTTRGLAITTSEGVTQHVFCGWNTT